MNSAALQLPIAEDAATALEQMVRAITSLEGLVGSWDESQRMTVQALKSAIEELNKEAFTRLIRSLKDDPGSTRASRPGGHRPAGLRRVAFPRPG